ncbi:hypothetical protein AWENTII_001952 [Aspergillus wentii]
MEMADVQPYGPHPVAISMPFDWQWASAFQVPSCFPVGWSLQASSYYHHFDIISSTFPFITYLAQSVSPFQRLLPGFFQPSPTPRWVQTPGVGVWSIIALWPLGPNAVLGGKDVHWRLSFP